MISLQKIALGTNIEYPRTSERLFKNLHMISPQKMVLETNFPCQRTLGLVLVSQTHQQKVVTFDQSTKDSIGHQY